MANALCAAGPNSKYQLAGAEPAGFLAGLWHGCICQVTFIISLFQPKVRIYETNNKGRIYEFGFLLGASLSIGGTGGQAGS